MSTGWHQFDDWLTVAEAVAYCLFKGLHRTSKTVRKWAALAAQSPDGRAEIAVRRQDTENGFRWLIERLSLDLKIEQEKDFETRRLNSKGDGNLSTPVATGAHPSAPVRDEINAISEMATAPHTSKPMPTGANQDTAQMIDFLMKQIDTKDQQIAVKDRQIESMLERDRETNVLIQGLQTSLTGVVRALPRALHEKNDQFPRPTHGLGDNSETLNSHGAI